MLCCRLCWYNIKTWTQKAPVDIAHIFLSLFRRGGRGGGEGVSSITNIYLCLLCHVRFSCTHTIPSNACLRIDHGCRTGGGLHGSYCALLSTSGESTGRPLKNNMLFQRWSDGIVQPSASICVKHQEKAWASDIVGGSGRIINTTDRSSVCVTTQAAK